MEDQKERLSEYCQATGLRFAVYNGDTPEYRTDGRDELLPGEVGTRTDIRDINEAYERANEVEFREWEPKTIEFDRLIAHLSEQTDKLWLEQAILPKIPIA